MRLGILGSTRGTAMMTIVDAIRQKKLLAEIAVVMSNKADALILKRATEEGVAALFVDAQGLTRESYDQKISTLLQRYAVDVVLLIGYMRILSSPFVEAWQNKVINIHPSLLPAFAGRMDLDVHRAVLESGALETGCTVHYVTDALDAGPILLQKKCPVLPTDTPETLKARVQQLEGDALVETLYYIK